MDLRLSDEQIRLQRLARDFAMREMKPVVAELDKLSDPNEVQKRFPGSGVAKLAEVRLDKMKKEGR